MNRALTLLSGGTATVACALIWHGPLGGGDRFATRVEKIARATLDYDELPNVSAHLERNPLSRTIVLSGPADEFQHNELLRIMGKVPGVNAVYWDPASLPQESRR